MEFNPADFPHVMEMPVRFSDLDAMRHVNNARYLTYFEEARIQWFEDLTGEARELMNWNVIVARIEVDYLWPVAYGDKPKIFTRVQHIGNRSFTLESVIAIEGDKPACRYKAVMVSYDYATGQARAVEGEFRKLLESGQ